MSLPPDIFQMGVRWIAIYISNNHVEVVAAGFNLRLIGEIFALITQPKGCGYIFQGFKGSSRIQS